MQLIDSRKQQLEYGQIMYLYYKNFVANDPKFKDPMVWFATIADIINKINPEIVIIGNTVFMAKQCSGEDGDKAMVWAMNADTLQNMVDNVAEGLTRLANMGVAHIVAVYEQAATSRPLRQAFNKIKSSEDKLVIKKLPNKQYFMYINLVGEDNV